MPAARITLAAVAGAHGIGGELRLKLFAESLASLKGHRAVRVGDKDYALSQVREGGQGAIARLDGVVSREAAEALRGKLVTVARDALPPLAPGEYYHADIIGLPCVDAAGASLGTVMAVEDFGAGELIEVEDADGRRALVPFRAPIAELGDDRVVIDPLYLI